MIITERATPIPTPIVFERVAIIQEFILARYKAAAAAAKFNNSNPSTKTFHQKQRLYMQKREGTKFLEAAT
jgi:hypothetical protein